MNNQKEKQNLISNKNTIKYIWKYLSDKKIGVITCLILVFVGTAATLWVNYQIKPIINDFIFLQDWAGLKTAISHLVIVIIIGALASWSQMQVMIRIAYDALTNIRKDLFHKMQKLPISFFDQRSHGDIMSYYTNDIEALQTCLDQSIVMVLNNIVRIAGTLILMYLLSPALLVITLIMTAIMLVASKIVSSKSKGFFIKQQDDIGELCGYGEEIIEGHQTIKAFLQENESKKKFDAKNKIYQTSSTKAQAYSGAIMPIVNQINSINFAITAVVGTLLVIDGKLDVGSLSAYIILTTNYNDPFKQITMQISNVQLGLSGARRIFSAIEMQEERDEGQVTLNDTSESPVWCCPQRNGKNKLIPFRGDICFHNVKFSYEKGKPIIRNISLHAQPGQKIALVGSTGSGKTTISSLISRFYEINEGTILFDGINIKDIKKDDMRKTLGMVLQDTHLFTGSILENIRYGCLEATTEDIIRAAKFARADYFISQLPDGYQTVLEKDGENLSSGQRQLIAIARTALSDPKVLILDEATSSVDTRTEAFVTKGMNALMDGRTVFVIAHRLSTIRDADVILVLENGKIIEQGDHNALLALKGRYYQLNTGMLEMA